MKYIYPLIILFIFLFVPPLQAASPLPQLKIVSPSDHQTVMGDKITVSFIVGNLRVGKEGHLHLYLDTDNETATEGYTEIQTHFDYQINGISRGDHKLTLEVVKPDHTSFSPGVIETVTFQTELPQNTETSSSINPSPLITSIGTSQTETSNNNHFLFLAFGTLFVICGIFIGLRARSR